MRCWFDERQLLHAPARELHNGAWADYAETPRRTEAILAALGDRARAPADHGEAAIRAVHDGGYVDFLKDAGRLWAEAGREGDAIGYVWPVVARRAVALDRIDALLGRYSFDATTPITPVSWDAAYWSAQTVLSALDDVLAGNPAFALCRPPGHHAGADYLGGYGFLNTAAIAAQAAIDRGLQRVAILDIDYHHGNGTQDIFWSRGDVFYASLHADPASDYPFYWGHGDECGEDDGLGATLNLPLPRGTAIDTFRAAQAEALAAIDRFAPELLIVSYGADTWEGDTISHFRLATADYAVLGGDIAKCGWPVLPVMEGGYAIDALGANVASFLSGLAR